MVPSLPTPNWAALAEGIRIGEETAVEQFYTIFNQGFRFFLKRHLGPHNIDDNVHDCVMEVLAAVRRATLRDPDRFAGFVMTIVKRYIAHAIAQKIADRSHADVEELGSLASGELSPESQTLDAETRRIAKLALNSLRRLDRDVLERFYLRDQSEQQIREELGLSMHAFRNIKHRAKAKFAFQCHRHAKFRQDHGFAGQYAHPIKIDPKGAGLAANEKSGQLLIVGLVA